MRYSEESNDNNNTNNNNNNNNNNNFIKIHNTCFTIKALQFIIMYIDDGP